MTGAETSPTTTPSAKVPCDIVVNIIILNCFCSEGVPTNGELCVELVSWEQDPLIVEQGSWNDDGCEVQKPFICQIFKQTVQFSFTVLGLATLSGGEIQG